MNALVTGGGGFLGRAIVRGLQGRGWSVRSFSRGDYPDLRADGVETVQGDLADYDAVYRAARGCEFVFHAGAKAGVWGPYSEYYRTNVLGTQNALWACKSLGITRLVYTSTPSVTFDGRDQEGEDESAQYARKFLAHYPRTKAIAEQLVLAANGDGLNTVALRPHLIWGPGDTQLVPRIVERARNGRLRIVGTGKQKVDTTYIDNAADAHLQAADALSDNGECGGKPYFISNDEPISLIDMINGILNAAGEPPVERHVSAHAAYAAGAILEAVYAATFRRDEPPMTRFVARQLATAHWYDISAAKKELGYRPTVSIGTGLERLRASLATTTLQDSN